MARSLTIVEIDIPAFTQNSPPNSPVPEQTFRFTTDTAYLPSTIDAIPSIRDVKITPAIISLGGDLGQRATVEVVLKDHKHVFASESYDSGTFWGKFRARYGLKLRGYPLRVLRGVVGDTIETMETRHFIIESTDGPTTKGEYKIIAKDVLKFADGDRAQAPTLSSGSLLADITATAGTLTLTPSGSGDEYGPSGYAAIGGKEIVQYSRLGIDAYDVLLVHGDGNSPTSIVDALSTPHTISVNGNATASTSQSKFGGASIVFDGTGDFLDLDGSSEFAFGSNDFAIDFQARFSSFTGSPILYDSRPTGITNGPYATIFVSATGQASYFVNNVAVIQAGSLATNTWYHFALARYSGVTRLFVDGVLIGTFTDTVVYLNGTSRPRIAANGSGAGNLLTGWIDEIKVSNGAARFAQAFTPPTAAYSAAGSGDVLTVIRARYNTLAAAHTAGDRVQLCLEYLGDDVADIIYDLLTNYANIDPDFITLANWQTETGTYLNTLYSALIAEPTPVNELVAELIEQASLVVWWDDISQQVRLQVLRAVSTTADTYNDDNTMMGSLEVREQPERRISQVYTYFNKINPLVNQDQIDNYGSSIVTVDADAEAEYGSASIKKIFSRWIPAGGRAVASSVNDILLARFVTPPRRVSFRVMRYSGDAPALGLGYQVEGWPFQGQTGAADMVPVQIVRLNPRADIFEVEAEEIFAGAEAAGGSPDNHTILIDSNTLNVNLRTMHDSLYSTAVSGTTVACTILAGILVGSSSTANPAFDVGSWASGVIINLTVLGRIEGAGGAGGTPSGSAGHAGGAGGKALYTRYPINLTDEDGAIWGGGGGGGSGAGNAPLESAYGGGGAGQVPGFAGATTTTGGPATPASGSIAASGAGGGPGLSGSTGGAEEAGPGGAGGAAGSAIDGITSGPVTTIGGAGDRRGGQIN